MIKHVGMFGMKRHAWGVDLVMIRWGGRGFGVDDVTRGWGDGGAGHVSCGSVAERRLARAYISTPERRRLRMTLNG